MRIREALICNPSILLYFIILFMPFIILYWMAPFFSNQTLGMDYPQFSIWYQIELMFSIKTGSFPLFVPGFAGGQSSASLTLGQIFHPLPYIASILPGYWNGKALEWNTLLRLLSLGISQLALFILLRRLKLTNVFAFLLSSITVYNLRMLDLFRYGASLESWTGQLLLCSAIGFYCLEPQRNLYRIFIIGATYWLICSGHPQMMYYGCLGSFIFALVFPFFLKTVLRDDREFSFKDTLHLWFGIGIYGGLGILLSSVYIIPFYFDFLLTSVRAVYATYAWADIYRDTFIGTLNNFFKPLHTDVHGAFGGSYLFLISVLIPVLALFKIKIPRIIWGLWGIVVLVFLYMQGGRLCIHYYFWRYFPLASSFRVAGRVSMLIPILILLILTWVVKSESSNLKILFHNAKIEPITLLAIFALIALFGYFLLTAFLNSGPTENYPTVINNGILPVWLEPLTIILGIVSLFTLIFYKLYPRTARFTGAILSVIICAQLTGNLRYGTWLEKKKDTHTFTEMLADNREKLYYRDPEGRFMHSSIIEKHIEHSFMEPFLGKICTNATEVANQDEAYNVMEEDRLPDHIFIEGKGIIDETFKPFTAAPGECRVNLVYSSFNRLVFEVYTPRPSFFLFAYPFTGQWNCKVDGQKVSVYRANGIFHGLAIKSGTSNIEFRFWSNPVFWGMLISLLTFAVTGVYFVYLTLKRPTSIIVMSGILGVAGEIFSIWYFSLYTGNNLGTNYRWITSQYTQPANIAYGKRTSMGEIPLCYRIKFLLYHSSRGVDGDITPDSGFCTYQEGHPFWEVDLGREREIGSIRLYESRVGRQWNKRPIKLMISKDKGQWHLVEEIYPIKREHNVVFPSPQKARYVRVEASKTCYFSLDEVEVYPPE